MTTGVLGELTTLPRPSSWTPECGACTLRLSSRIAMPKYGHLRADRRSTASTDLNPKPDHNSWLSMNKGISTVTDCSTFWVQLFNINAIGF